MNDVLIDMMMAVAGFVLTGFRMHETYRPRKWRLT